MDTKNQTVTGGGNAPLRHNESPEYLAAVQRWIDNGTDSLSEKDARLIRNVELLAGKPDPDVLRDISARLNALNGTWPSKVVTLYAGEGVIHQNDYLYFEACERGLKQAIKVLNQIADEVDGTGTATMCFQTVDGIKSMLDMSDPLRDTVGASFVKSIESDK